MEKTEEILQDLSNFPSVFQRRNIVMIKGFKVGGSTLSGVMRHIAAHNNISGFEDDEWISDEPGLWATHNSYRELQQRIETLKQGKFVLTMLRDPIARCMSDFYFSSTAKEETWAKLGRSAGDFNDKVKYFTKFCTDHSFEYIRPRKTKSVSKVLDRYDFIGFTERFNESMVLLKHVLGVPWRDVLYIPSKITGDAGLSFVRSQRYSNVSRTKFEDQPDDLKEFVKKDWREKNKDFELHERAMAQFDKQIAMIPDFEIQVQKYELILDTMQRMCSWLIRNTTRETILGNLVRKTYMKDAQRAYHCLNQIGDVDRYFE